MVDLNSLRREELKNFGPDAIPEVATRTPASRPRQPPRLDRLARSRDAGDGGAAHTEIVRLRLAHGGNVNLAGSQGVPALAHAEQRGQQAIADVFGRTAVTVRR